MTLTQFRIDQSSYSWEITSCKYLSVHNEAFMVPVVVRVPLDLCSSGIGVNIL